MKKILTLSFLLVFAALAGMPLFAQSQLPANWQECAEQISREWELVRMDKKGNAPIEFGDDAQKERIVFFKDNRVMMFKGNNSGGGMWKYSPVDNKINIADKESGEVTSFTLITLSSDELVLLYEPYTEVRTVMYYRPL